MRLEEMREYLEELNEYARSGFNERETTDLREMVRFLCCLRMYAGPLSNSQWVDNNKRRNSRGALHAQALTYTLHTHTQTHHYADGSIE